MKELKQIIYLFTASLIVSSCSKDNSSGATTTPTTPVNTNPISGQFQKRVLIEDFTGTWCGYCPRVAYGIDKVMLGTNKAVPVAIHQKSGSSDPFDFAGATPLASQINLSSFPTGMLNRTITWQYPENTNISQPEGLVANNEGLGLAMDSTLSNGIFNLNVNVKFAKDYTGLKLVVYILEDKLSATQQNYTSNLYGTGNVDPLVNFEEDHVLRFCLTNILGDPITNTTLTGQTITKNFNLSVPTNVNNVANMSFVAFVVGSDNTAINVRSSVPGETQTFEQNP